ncbi:MAG: hypothetical protein K0S42_3074, partial [Microvirga sp.]|nr:hypothetical protein [Microvirga sp.]
EVCKQLLKQTAWDVDYMKKEIPPLIALLTDVLTILNKENRDAA